MGGGGRGESQNVLIQKSGLTGEGGRDWDGNFLEFGRGEADGMGDEDGGEAV